MAAFAAAIGPVSLAFGKVTKGISGVSKVIGTFLTAVGKAGGGWKGLAATIAPTVWLTAALADFASGARQTRVATEGMISTAEQFFLLKMEITKRFPLERWRLLP